MFLFRFCWKAECQRCRCLLKRRIELFAVIASKSRSTRCISHVLGGWASTVVWSLECTVDGRSTEHRISVASFLVCLSTHQPQTGVFWTMDGGRTDGRGLVRLLIKFSRKKTTFFPIYSFSICEHYFNFITILIDYNKHDSLINKTYYYFVLNC